MDRNLVVWAVVRVCEVALRKESVDRNRQPTQKAVNMPRSLSARRAWIEIMALDQYLKEQEVALRKESVDRNAGYLRSSLVSAGRSPQGERG